MISGHVTICKVYNNGTKELVLNKSNLVTKGLGSSFIDLQQNAGSTQIVDYTPRYFQVGTSDVAYETESSGASSTFYRLSAPFDWSDYGEDTELTLVKAYRGFNASVSPDVDDGSLYRELFTTSAALSATVFSGTDEYFAEINSGHLTKFYLDAFEAEIVLDENSGNGKAISEVGLFIKNPKGFKKDSPLMIAYKNFTPLTKSKEFSLVIHWAIGFLGLSTSMDKYNTASLGSQGEDDYQIAGEPD